MLSQPTRAAWIEIKTHVAELMGISRRSPLGLRGLKFLKAAAAIRWVGQSQPTRAAWIEIKLAFILAKRSISRSPLGLRGLKLLAGGRTLIANRSQPTRAAWIEIFNSSSVGGTYSVAAHSGCVD